MKTKISGESPDSIHQDPAEGGVIIHGRYPPKGSLELELEKYGINYIVFEVPQLKKLSDRIKALTHGVTYFIKHLD